MKTFTRLGIADAWIVDPVRHADERGWFQELFKFSDIQNATGIEFSPVQINVSHSRQGVIRGIHYSLAPEGQAKYVSVMDGEIDDYVVDLRPNSSTFGSWERVRLSSENGKSVLLSSNLAHAFQVISPLATVCYAVTAEFNPAAEKAVNPFCLRLAIEWENSVPAQVSPKDESAPSLDEVLKIGLLPN